MRFTQAFASAALFSAALAQSTPSSEEVVYTTVVTTDYTTYCPSPTTFIHKNVTYTATSATTLTITNCPCTVTYSSKPPTPPGPSNTVVPPPVGPTVIPPPHGNTTAVPPPVVPSSILTTETYISGSITSVITTEIPNPTGVVPVPSASESVPAGGETTTAVVPVGPTSSGAVPVPTAAAEKNNAGLGALVIAGFAALMI